MEKPDAESFKLLTISVEKLPASMAQHQRISTYATARAKLLLGCYRTGDANDPDTYVAAIAATLARYPEHIITSVTHPVSGLPSKKSWLPTVKEVFEACEELDEFERENRARQARIAEQLEARRIEDEAKAAAPTYDNLKEKYGADWGIKNPDHKKRSPAAPAPNIEQLRHHYRHYDLQFRPKHQDELEQQLDRGIGPKGMPLPAAPPADKTK